MSLATNFEDANEEEHEMIDSPFGFGKVKKFRSTAKRPVQNQLVVEFTEYWSLVGVSPIQDAIEFWSIHEMVSLKLIFALIISSNHMV